MSLLSRGMSSCHPRSSSAAGKYQLLKLKRRTYYNLSHYSCRLSPQMITSLKYDNLQLYNSMNSLPVFHKKQTSTCNSYYQLQHKRHLSDNLLGYSPMAPNSPNSQNKNIKSSKESKPQGPIIGVDSNTEGGGVWSQTSAKKNKLSELKMELKFDLGQRSLDDVATEEEKYDLYLIDGVSALAKMVDCGGVCDDLVMDKKENVVLKQVQFMMKEYKDSIASSSDNVNDEGKKIEINRKQFDAHISTLIKYVKEQRETHPAAPNGYIPSLQPETDGTLPPALLYVRDFLLYKPPNPDEAIPSKISNELNTPISTSFSLCFEYFQIILLQSALEYLMTQWDTLTKTSSGDQDRAAVRGDTLTPVETLDISKLHLVVNAFGSGSCSGRIQALWNLMDKDNDSMLDQEEMDRVVYMSIAPMEDAIKKFISDCMDVWPLRKFGLPPPCLEQVHDSEKGGKKLGFYRKWKEERRERQSRRTLMKLLDGTVKNHFEVEAETPHRLRCIYAWADKNNQDGKTESVLVDATNNNETGSSGFFSGTRKRYVELDPKISYSEFQAEQVDHFPHLDRVGQELCTSLKEDLWVHQGQNRQNQELKREIAAFLVIVSIIDYAITSN